MNYSAIDRFTTNGNLQNHVKNMHETPDRQIVIQNAAGAGELLTEFNFLMLEKLEK